jgi:hypothetical protein
MSTPEQSGGGQKGGGERLEVPEQPLAAAQSLLIIQSLIATDEGRREYKESPARAFRNELSRREDLAAKNPGYEDIPPNSRAALERLSESELKLLSELDQTFIKDGLYVQVPDPGALHFK